MEVDVSVENLVAMVWWKRKTRDYHQKLNVGVEQIAEQFRTYDLKK